MKIAVAGTGYVGLSNAIILAQHNKVYAVDVVPSKVDLINSKKSPIIDKEIEEYLATKDLDLTATLGLTLLTCSITNSTDDVSNLLVIAS